MTYFSHSWFTLKLYFISTFFSNHFSNGNAAVRGVEDVE